MNIPILVFLGALFVFLGVPIIITIVNFVFIGIPIMIWELKRN